MRLFFFGPRFFGIRPGISLGREDFRRRSAQAPIEGSFIYSISGPPGMVKVGVTTDPAARFAALQTGSPYALGLNVLLATPGDGYLVEARAHEILADYRARGEWFRCSPARTLFAIRQALDELEEPFLSVSMERAEEILAVARSAPAGPARRPAWIRYAIGAVTFAGTLFAVCIWFKILTRP